MEKRTFGQTGWQVSVLGFGAAPIGYLQTDREQASRLLNYVLDQDINLIDTAASYPDAEVVIGEAIGHRRDDYFLVSKCGTEVPHLKGKPWSKQLVAATVDASLQRLKTDHLDVMLLHSCGMDVLKKGAALEALVRAREAGKVRYIGYSGDNAEAAYAVVLPDVAVVELSINICDQANIDNVLPLALEHNVGVLAKRPIANAAWKERAQQPGMYAEYAEPYARRFQAMGLSLAKLNGKVQDADWPDIALRFTLSQPGVHCAIIGTTNPQHAEHNLQAVRQGPLQASTLRSLREAFARGQAAAGEPWPGLT